ncbi:MAG: tetratricopeptide repeat protein, partial [Duganella sp.]
GTMNNMGGGYSPGAQNGYPPPPGHPPGGYPAPGQGYPQQGYPQAQGSGMGSRIMGGLATGAAVGAGFVAAEAIARQFGGNHAADSQATEHGRNDIIYEDPSTSNIVQNDNMGGNDFGVSGGWDDGGGDAGGGDDWN